MGWLARIFAWVRKSPAIEQEREQSIGGILVAAGACEFFAKTPIGEIHGTWHGDDDAPSGTPVKIVLPPEIFRLDDFPPEENYFRLSDAGTLHIAAAREFSGDPEDCFVWFFPEDAHGYPLEN